MVLSNAEFQHQMDAATRRGERRLELQPVAETVRYDRRLRKIVIALNNGCTLLIPTELAQGLSNASAGDLAKARVLGPGTTIEWPELDVQLSVAGLLNGRFGTARWMQKRDRTTKDLKVSRRRSRKPRSLRSKR